MQQIGRPYRRRKLRKQRLLVVFALLLVMVIFAVAWCGRAPKGVYPERIGQIPVVTDLMSPDFAGRPGTLRRIRWIVVHETGNQNEGADAQAHNNLLHSQNQAQSTVSWHYTVDDQVIYHHLPDDEIAWHAGDLLTPDGGNQNGIGIEICVNQDGNYDQGVANAAELVAYLLEAYDLQLTDVKQHGDFIKKDCPHFLREGDNWQKFLDQVAQALKA